LRYASANSDFRIARQTSFWARRQADGNGPADGLVPEPVLDWLGGAVLESNRTEQAAREQTIKRLQARCERIEARIETMYTDKLAGRITQEFFDKQNTVWRAEREGVLRKVQDVQNAAPAPINQAIDMTLLDAKNNAAIRLLLQ
jgi:hypothetical protein